MHCSLVVVAKVVSEFSSKLYDHACFLLLLNIPNQAVLSIIEDHKAKQSKHPEHTYSHVVCL